MTPTQIEQAARRRYNAVSDTFWSQDEIFELAYGGSLELAHEAFVIESTSSVSTVASTQDYTIPTNAIAIKRLTYDGRKLQPITMREDDRLTLNNSTVTTTGNPIYYFLWNRTISLRPIPDSVKTLKYWTNLEPSTITVASTLDIPSSYHMDLVYYIVGSMYEKDQNINMATYYRNLWSLAITRAKALYRKQKRGDAFSVVQDEESLSISIIGPT